MKGLRWKERLAESFWFIPSLCVSFAAAAALLLLQLDHHLGGDERGLGFTGGPESARAVLSTVASSMLTIAGLVFSITIVALQLTSSQFSPRALGTFLRDRRTQVSLGVFVATFVYALVALRAVRGQDGSTQQFVPAVTITGAFMLAILGIGTFIYYIHHITHSIRVITVIRRIGEETRRAIDALPEPTAAEGAALPAHGPVKTLPAPRSGVLAAVKMEELVSVAGKAGTVIEVVPAVGDFVPQDAPLIRLHGGDGVDDDRLLACLLVRAERSMRGDPAYGLRQLVDIAERALSPGINDPSTAVQCLDQIHDVLRQLAVRPLPTGRCSDKDGRLRVVIRMPSWSDYVHQGLDEIRHWGACSLQVQRRLHQLLDDLQSAAGPLRQAPLVEQRRLLELVADAADV